LRTTPWDKEQLPNPEIYMVEKRNYIEQSNMCYTEAAKFILAHELTHLERHIDILEKDTTGSNYLAFKEETDRLPIEHVLKGIP
jgi:Zn-dependent peptidase ImmA (M78 family)